MRIIPPAAFSRQPWKNGAGITHEIARKEDAAGLLWRLSIAEVGSDGPFSAFPGLARILTVIEGAGLYLDTAEGRLDALPFTPVGFAGDIAVHCRLIDGPVRDFNLIHDPARIRARVTVPAPGSATPCPPARQRHYAALAAGPGCHLDGAEMPEGAVAEFTEAGQLRSATSPMILVTIDPL